VRLDTAQVGGGRVCWRPHEAPVPLVRNCRCTSSLVLWGRSGWVGGCAARQLRCAIQPQQQRGPPYGLAQHAQGRHQAAHPRVLKNQGGAMATTVTPTHKRRQRRRYGTRSRGRQRRTGAHASTAPTACSQPPPHSPAAACPVPPASNQPRERPTPPKTARRPLTSHAAVLQYMFGAKVNTDAHSAVTSCRLEMPCGQAASAAAAACVRVVVCCVERSSAPCTNRPRHAAAPCTTP
jgi:hypothetical protein